MTASAFSINNLLAGNYTITATDANGCTISSAFSISAATPGCALAVVSLAASPISCFGKADGSLDLTVSGGSGAVQFTWSNGLPAVEDHQNLAAGNYLVTVSDGLGCSVFASATVVEPAELLLSALPNAANCFGQASGQIAATASGGTSPVVFSWSNGLPNGPIQANLSAGVFSVTVTDAKGCSKSQAGIVVGQPAQIAFSASQSAPVSTVGASDGKGQLNFSGGVLPYQIAWAGPQNGSTMANAAGFFDIQNLAAGSYSATLTDQNGCSETANFSISDCAISVSAIVSQPKCAASNDGSIDLTASGAPNLTFSWSHGPISEDVSGLSAGVFSVMVSGAGCSVVHSETLAAPPSISISNAAATDVLCFGQNSGSISIDATGGTPPISFDWSGAAPSVEDSTGLFAGVFSVTATDANGCSAMILGISVGQPAAGLSFSASQSAPVSSLGASDGKGQLTFFGGVSPFSVAWNGPSSGSASNLATGFFEIQNLAAGNYSATLTDQNDCSATANFLISDCAISVSALIAEPTCAGFSDGTIDLNVTGATASPIYFWSNGSSAQDLSGLAAGPFSVIVSNGTGGCTVVFSTNLADPQPLAASGVSVKDASCFGKNDGQIGLQITGGTAPFQFDWAGPNGFSAQNEDLAGLLAGIYSLEVSDSKSCTKNFGPFEIKEPMAIQLSACCA